MIIERVFCNYYSESRGMKCGDINRVFSLKGEDLHYYCPECRTKNYKLKQLSKFDYYYNQCLNDVLEILDKSLSYDEKIKLIRNLRKENGKKDI